MKSLGPSIAGGCRGTSGAPGYSEVNRGDGMHRKAPQVLAGEDLLVAVGGQRAV